MTENLEKIIIIRYSEIHLKGNNRGFFEKLLQNNIMRSLKDFNITFYKISGRYIIENFKNESLDLILGKLDKISGIHSYSLAYKVVSDFDIITQTAITLLKDKNICTFKVETNRADKNFEFNSIEISRLVGKVILENYPSLKVDLTRPDLTLFIDVREKNITFIFSNIVKGMGGMPVGSSGNGLLMLSGGIDSPVAGYMMAKRGMRISAIHFHSYPFTSLQAKNKVIELAKILSDYTQEINLYIVKFTRIQEEIHKKCRPDFMVTIMRRFMMRIAEQLALKHKIQCIITGECLGQVASQTIEGLISTNNALKEISVLRPLIAFDKSDIIDISEKIKTYETSILPYEDCCTVFLPKHPIIKPKIADIIKEELKLDIDNLVLEVINDVEFIKL